VFFFLLLLINLSAVQGESTPRPSARWGTADPTIVSLELLTVFGAGPLAAYIVYQIVKGDPRRYYWIIVLCTAELYPPTPTQAQADPMI
jgi:hypothetical protein